MRRPRTDKAQRVGEQPLAAQTSPASRPKNGRRSKSIDKSVLALPAAPVVRDREHVRHVAKQPCPICGRRPLGYPPPALRAKPGLLSRKVSDEFTVPCAGGTIAKSTAAAMNVGGGRTQAWIPLFFPCALAGTHPLSPVSNAERGDAAEPSVTRALDHADLKRNRPVRGQRTHRKTNSMQSTNPNGNA